MVTKAYFGIKTILLLVLADPECQLRGLSVSVTVLSVGWPRNYVGKPALDAAPNAGGLNKTKGRKQKEAAACASPTLPSLPPLPGHHAQASVFQSFSRGSQQ